MFEKCVMVSDVRASNFRASGGLEPSIFLKFGLRAGSGRAKFASDERAGGPSPIFMGTKYRFWVSSSFEPTFFFEVRASGGLGPSKICFGRAGGRAEPDIYGYQVPNLGIELIRAYIFF